MTVCLTKKITGESGEFWLAASAFLKFGFSLPAVFKNDCGSSQIFRRAFLTVAAEKISDPEIYFNWDKIHCQKFR